MKLVDANVFIYARGGEHKYKRSCESLVKSIYEGRIDATIDIEVLQEFIHYYHSRGRTEIGLQMAMSVAGFFSNALPITVATMTAAVAVLRRYPLIESRDAVHVAVVSQYNLEGIISTDRGFDIIDGLKRFDPKELAA